MEKGGHDDNEVTLVGSEEQNLNPVITLDACSGLLFVGLHIKANGNSIGVRVKGCEDVLLQSCTVSAPQICVHDMDQSPVPSRLNELRIDSTVSFLTKLRTYPLHSSFIFFGYLYTLGLYVTLSLMCLFVTAALSQQDADTWLWNSAVSVVIDVFAVTPIICILQDAFEVMGKEMKGYHTSFLRGCMSRLAQQ